MVVPQRRFDAPTHERLRGPTRIGGDECAVALDRGAVVVTAQDDPFGELPRHRIRYLRLGLRRIRRLVLAYQLDDVFQRILIGLRGRRRRGQRGRRRRFTRRRRRQSRVLARRGVAPGGRGGGGG